MEKRNLTLKEIEVMKQVTAGKSRKEIAHALGITTGTLNSHFKRIFIKIQVRSMAEAVIWAFKNAMHN